MNENETALLAICKKKNWKILHGYRNNQNTRKTRDWAQNSTYKITLFFFLSQCPSYIFHYIFWQNILTLIYRLRFYGIPQIIVDIIIEKTIYLQRHTHSSDIMTNTIHLPYNLSISLSYPQNGPPLIFIQLNGRKKPY